MKVSISHLNQLSIVYYGRKNSWITVAVVKHLSITVHLHTVQQLQTRYTCGISHIWMVHIRVCFTICTSSQDLYDRSIVGWEVYEEESAEHASELIQQICLKQGRPTTQPLVLHSDNGSPMKGATMLATLYQLGITPSNSRPRKHPVPVPRKKWGEGTVRNNWLP